MNPIIDRLHAQACATPEAVAFFTMGRPTTFAQLQRLVTQMAEQLQAQGVQAGHTVSLSVQNPFTLACLSLACMHRAVAVCVLPTGQPWPDSLSSDWLMTDHPVQPPAHLGTVVSLDAAWLKALATQPGQLPAQAFEGPHAICRLQQSSGSTGTPKSIRIGVQTLHERALQRHAQLPGRGGIIVLFDQSTLPGMHAAWRPLYTGQPTHLCPDLKAMWQVLAKQPLAYVSGSPAQLADLARMGESLNTRAARLEALVTGGGPVREPLLRLLQQRLCADVLVRYASSEVGTVAVADTATLRSTPQVAGRVMPGVVVEVIDAQDQLLPPGQEGQVRLRTPYMAAGYTQPEAEGFRDGWFYPGDLGVLDATGLLYITGRADHVINLGGMKVNAQTVDDLLASAPGVQQGLTTQAPDAQGLSVMMCAVVPAPGFDMSAVRQHIEQALPPALHPRWIIEVAQIPRTASGKPDRAATAIDLVARLQAQGVGL
jgi:acyl-coenzyme A synthetase/AMP-(fatty) acid ligase